MLRFGIRKPLRACVVALFGSSNKGRLLKRVAYLSVLSGEKHSGPYQWNILIKISMASLVDTWWICLFTSNSTYNSLEAESLKDVANYSAGWSRDYEASTDREIFAHVNRQMSVILTCCFLLVAEARIGRRWRVSLETLQVDASRRRTFLDEDVPQHVSIVFNALKSENTGWNRRLTVLTAPYSIQYIILYII